MKKIFWSCLISILLFSGCYRRATIVEQQYVKIRIDTVYTYTYKLRFKDNTTDFLETRDKFSIGDTTNVLK